MENKRTAYEDQRIAQLKEWGAQISILKAKAQMAKVDVKNDYFTVINTFQRKQDEAKTELQELKAVGDDVWEDLKTETERSWSEVKAAYQDATLRFI